MTTNKKEINKTTSPTISYSGEVTVKVLNGNRVIKHRTIHNNGTPRLFQTLCKALIGEASNLDTPSRLVLYEIHSNSGYNPEDFSTGDLKVILSSGNATLATLPSVWVSPPILKEVNGSYSAIFQFKIPYTVINTGNIHVMALLPNNATNQEDNYTNSILAYYLLQSNATTWDPIEIDSTALNNCLLVEWAMSFDNKNLEEAD